MSKISKFVLLSPETFYTRKLSYTCTGCGKPFSLDQTVSSDELDRLRTEHICSRQEPGTVSGAFPAIRMLRNYERERSKH
jgi:DNA-directed RNA polymerase subunit RPC12/RpoP